MATYKFECDRCGARVEATAAMKDAPSRLKCEICGAQMHRDYQREVAAGSASTGEIVSVNAGCGVGQEEAFSRDLAEAGIDAYHRKTDGSLVARGRGAFQDALALRGLHSNTDGGFDGKRRQSIRRLGLSKAASR